MKNEEYMQYEQMNKEASSQIKNHDIQEKKIDCNFIHKDQIIIN